MEVKIEKKALKEFARLSKVEQQEIITILQSGEQVGLRQHKSPLKSSVYSWGWNGYKIFYKINQDYLILGVSNDKEAFGTIIDRADNKAKSSKITQTRAA